MYSLLHFYGGLTLDTVRGMSIFEIDEALKYMNEQIRRENGKG
jgi:hypothetical protein